MSRRKGGWVSILALFVGLVALGVVYTLRHPYWFADLVDNWLMDSKHHHVPCEQLPSEAEIRRVMQAHQDVLQQIEALDPYGMGLESGAIGVDIVPCAPGHASLTFWYLSHRQRVAIERLIGSDTFFGVPYNLENR